MIPFNKPYVSGLELDFIADAQSRGHLSGDGYYTRLSSNWLEQNLEAGKALLTHSCTAALEMAAILADISPGDEVIMPSYTFVSTANAFVLRGAVPVFVDIRMDTLNMDETRIEEAITSKTRAIVPVHYAGVACEMDTIMEIANEHGLLVIEDAAQAINTEYKGMKLGTIGHLGCLSFHETKNIQSGEGGALLINDSKLAERAEIIREKGTNRSQFFRGEVDKYTWQDLGSSYLPSDISAAFLFAQLTKCESILNMRRSAWDFYDDQFIQHPEFIESHITPMNNTLTHNAHMFYLIAENLEKKEALRSIFLESGLSAVTHYVPLHSSPAGQRLGRKSGTLPVTERVSASLLRLPLYPELNFQKVHDALSAVTKSKYFLS